MKGFSYNENKMAFLIQNASNNKKVSTTDLDVIFNGLTGKRDFKTDRLTNIIDPYVDKMISGYVSKNILVLEEEVKFLDRVQNRIYIITELGEQYFSE